MEKEKNNKGFYIKLSIVCLIIAEYLALTIAAGSALLDHDIANPFDLGSAFMAAVNESPFYLFHFTGHSFPYAMIALIVVVLVVAIIYVEDEKRRHDKLGGVKWNMDAKAFNLKFNEVDVTKDNKKKKK